MNHLKIADKIYTATTSLLPIPPIHQLMNPKTIEDAYTIQKINIKKNIDNGNAIIGRKIGLTAPSVQKQLGVSQPDFGYLCANFKRNNNSTIKLNTLIQPKIEAEIALIIKKKLTLKKYTFNTFLDYIDYVQPALEIVDSRIENWNISIFDTIADNASCGLFVLGNQKVEARKVDWENCTMQMYNHKKIVSEGCGKVCLGNPINAAIWLAETMANLNAPIQKGEIILTGALGPMHTIQKGDIIESNITTVGTVNTQFI